MDSGKKSSIHPFVDATQSPIERAMAGALVRNWRCAGGNVEFVPLATVHQLMARVASNGWWKIAVHIAPQVRIGDYRVDFLCAYDVPTTSIVQLTAIECDGHQFHEKTREQVARDKRRGRDLMRAGIQTMRFSGSEIWFDADDCAMSVYDTIFAHSYKHLADAGLVPPSAEYSL